MADSNGEKPVSRQELTEALSAQKAEFLSAVKEVVHDTETKLLNPFFLYQEHGQIQFRKLAADNGNANKASELRLDNLEQRIIELEKRTLGGQTPPQSK